MKLHKKIALLTLFIIGVITINDKSSSNAFAQTNTITCPSGDSTTCVRIEGAGTIYKGEGTIKGKGTIEDTQ